MIFDCPTLLCHWHYCADEMEEPTLCKEPCTTPAWAGGTCRCRNCFCEGGACMIAPNTSGSGASNCGDCCRYWHAEGRMWGAEVTAEEWDVALPDGMVLSSWGESGCTQGLALHIEGTDWWGHLGGNLSEDGTREILQGLRRNTLEEMLRWPVDFPDGW